MAFGSLPAYAMETPAPLDVTAHTGAEEIFVSTDGSNSNPGTFERPLQTVAAARTLVRAINDDMDNDIVVYLRGGVYPQTETLNFSKEDSGTNGHTITYKAYDGEAVSISGGRPVNGWTLFDEEKGIYSAEFGSEIDTRQLYVNNKRATRARSVGGISGCIIDPGAAAGSLGMATSDIDMVNWKNWESIEFSYVGAWTLPRCIAQKIEINPKNARQAIITMAQPCWFNARNKGASSVENPPQWVENAYELLDEPGEWYLDKTGAIGGAAHTFYYKPLEGEDMSKAEAVTPVLEEIMHIESDNIDEPVSNLQFQGITFEHGTWLRPNTMGMVDAQDNNIREPQNKGDTATGGNIYLKSTQNIVFNSCEFTRMGNIAIFMHQGNKDNLVVGCHFYDLSAQAVKVGDVRYGDPLNFYLWDDKNDPSTSVTMDSWDWRYLQSNNDVINNVIHDIGQEFYSAAAISAGVIEESDFSYNEIYNIPYSGFHIGYGWTAWPEMVSPMGNNRIQYNYIHDCMLKQKDGGAIYTIGVQACAKGEDGWARKSIISNNYIADQAKLYGSIYLDEGANYYDVYDNVVQNTPEFLLTKHVRNYIHDNYSNQTNMANHASPFEPGSAKLENNSFFVGDSLPEGALPIVAEAGMQEGFSHNHFSCAMAKGKMTLDYDANLEYPLTVNTKNLMNAKNGDRIQLSLQSAELAEKECKALIKGQALSGTGNAEGKVYFGEPVAVNDLPEILGKDGLTAEVQFPLAPGKSTVTVAWEKVSGGEITTLLSQSKSLYSSSEDLSEYDQVLDVDLSEYADGAITSNDNPDGISFPTNASVKITVEENADDGRFIKFNKTGKTSSSYVASIPVTPATAGKTIIKYKLRPNQANAKMYGLGVNTAKAGLMGVTYMHESNKRVHEHSSGALDLGTYTVGKWDDVTLTLDLDKDTYEVAVNNQLTMENGPLNEATDKQVTYLALGMYSGHTGSFDLKDIAVYTSVIPQATLGMEDISEDGDYKLKLTTSNVKNLPEEAQLQYRLTLPEGIIGDVTFGSDDVALIDDGKAVSAAFAPPAAGEALETIAALPKPETGTHTIKAELFYTLDGAECVLGTKSLTMKIINSMNTAFEMDLSGYTEGEKISENANAGGITVTGEQGTDAVTVELVNGEKAIKFYKTSAETTPVLEIPLTDVGGFIEVTADIKGPEKAAIAYTLNLSDDIGTLAQVFHRNGQIWHWNQSGGEVYDGNYDVAAWHSVKLTVDPDAKTSAIYLNDRLLKDNIPWRDSSTGAVTKLESSLYRKSKGTFYIKNLVVKSSKTPSQQGVQSFDAGQSFAVAQNLAQVQILKKSRVLAPATPAPINEAPANVNGFDASRAEFISGLKEKEVGEYYVSMFRRLSMGSRFNAEQYEALTEQSEIMIALLKEANPEALTDPEAFDIEKFSEEQKAVLYSAYNLSLDILNLYLLDSRLINNEFLNPKTEGYEAAVVSARIFDRNTHDLLMTIQNDDGVKNWGLIQSVEALASTVNAHDRFELPAEVEVTLDDGAAKTVPAFWDAKANTNAEGVFTLYGYVPEFPQKISFVLTVTPYQKPDNPGSPVLPAEPENPDNPNKPETPGKIDEVKDAIGKLPDPGAELGDKDKASIEEAAKGARELPPEEAEKMSLGDLQKLEALLNKLRDEQPEVNDAESVMDDVIGLALSAGTNGDNVLLNIKKAATESFNVKGALLALDMNYLVNGAKAKPGFPIWFKLTLPKEMQGKQLGLWHIGDDGSKEKIALQSLSATEAGFWARSFSSYVFVDAAQPKPTPTPKPIAKETEETAVKITVEAGPGGKVGPAGPVEAKLGDDVTLTITPDTGYEVWQAFVDDKEVALTDGVYIFKEVADNHSFRVTFRMPEVKPESSVNSEASEKPESSEAPAAPAAPENPSNPKAGVGSIVLWLAIALAAVLAAVIIVRRKTSQKTKR